MLSLVWFSSSPGKQTIGKDEPDKVIATNADSFSSVDFGGVEKVVNIDCIDIDTA